MPLKISGACPAQSALQAPKNTSLIKLRLLRPQLDSMPLIAHYSYVAKVDNLVHV
jgi:hypothetical protein